MKVFMLILLLFAIGQSFCEILTAVSSKKAIIYSDKDYESHTVFIDSGNNERLRRFITQECEIHGFLKTSKILTRTKRGFESIASKVVPLVVKYAPKAAPHVASGVKFAVKNKETIKTAAKIGTLVSAGVSAYARIKLEKKVDNIEKKVDEAMEKIGEIAGKMTVIEEKIVDMRSQQNIEREADDVVRSAINLLFNDHKLSPLLLNINPLVKLIVSHEIGEIRLVDLLHAKVTNCHKKDDATVKVELSVRIPNKIKVEEIAKSIDTGFVHEEHYYFFDLPRAVYSKNGTKFMIPLESCIEKDSYLCPFRLIEETACFYGNTSECSLVALPLEKNKCGITSIRRAPAFGAIVVANTKEMFEVGDGSSRTMEVEPNSVLRVNVRHGKLIEVCDQTITSMKNDLNETKIDVIPSALQEAWPGQDRYILKKIAESPGKKNFKWIIALIVVGVILILLFYGVCTHRKIYTRIRN